MTDLKKKAEGGDLVSVPFPAFHQGAGSMQHSVHPLAFGEVKAAENGTAGFCSKMAKSTMLETVIGQPGNEEG